MKIKDQIKSQRERLNMDTTQLAKRVGVTNQAVLHWESGRSYPKKQRMHDVEQALSFELDWTEGLQSKREGTTAVAMLAQEDIDLLLIICKLPFAAKEALKKIAYLHLEAVELGRPLQSPASPVLAPAPSRKPQRPPTRP
jgi:transcriptional regulator with XRE-family HTH domain